MNRLALLSILMLAAIAVCGGPVFDLDMDTYASQYSTDVLELLRAAGCTVCEDTEGCAQGEFMLAPSENRQEMDVIFYNGTIERSAIKNAPIIVYVYNNSESAIFKTYTDEEGVAGFEFEQWNASCHDYMIFYCRGGSGCDFETCLKAIGLNATDLGLASVDDIPLGPGATASGGPQDPEHVLPAYTTYRYCPPPDEGGGMPIFCLPLILIMTFLLGSMYLSGKNPFMLFDFSSPRMGKFMRYTARGRGFGFDMMAIASAVTTVVSIAKNPKGAFEKDKKAMKQGGAIGGVAAGVFRGVRQSKKGVAGYREVKGRWASWKTKKGAAASWKEVGKTMLHSTGLGRIISDTAIAVKGAKKGKGAAAGAKAFFMGLAMQSSFAPLVSAIQTAYLLWNVASSVEAAKKERQGWTETKRFVGKDNKTYELEAKKDKDGKIIYSLYEMAPSPSGTGLARIGIGQHFSDGKQIETFLLKNNVPDGLNLMKKIEISYISSEMRYHRTVAFFMPLEIEKVERGKGGLVDQLKSSNLKDNPGQELKIGNGRGETIGTISAGTISEIAKTGLDDSRQGTIITIKGEDGNPKTIIVSKEAYEQQLLPKGTVVISKVGDIDLSKIVSGIDKNSEQAKMLDLHNSISVAGSVESMKAMVASSAAMYNHLENKVLPNIVTQFDARTKAVSEALEKPLAQNSNVTIGGETKTVADWIAAGKKDELVTHLASDPTGAPPSLKTLAESAYKLYHGEAMTAANLSEISKTTTILANDIDKASWLEGVGRLKAEVNAKVILAQQAAVGAGTMEDVGKFERASFKDSTAAPDISYLRMAEENIRRITAQMGTDAGRVAITIELDRAKEALTAIPPDMRTTDEQRHLDTIEATIAAAKAKEAQIEAAASKNPAEIKQANKEYQEAVRNLSTVSLSFAAYDPAKPPPTITESEALMAKHQALTVVTDMFERGKTSDESRHMVERMFNNVILDATTNPKDAMKSLNVLSAFAAASEPQAKLIFERYENYVTSPQKERGSVIERMRIDDATERLANRVYATALDSSPEARAAFSQALRDAPGGGGGTDMTSIHTTAAERKFPEEVESKWEKFEEAKKEWAKKREEYEDLQKRGKTGIQLENAKTAMEQSKQAVDGTRDEYYSSGRKVLGDTQLATIVQNHIKHGSDAGQMLGAFEQFKKHAADSPDMKTASATLDKDVAYLKFKDDPLGPARDSQGKLLFGSNIGAAPPPQYRPFDYGVAQGLHNAVFEGVVNSTDPMAMDAVSRARERGLLK
ncbi:MAG: ABC transporter C-terminal domain-containing protein [Candidatus Micrarchaeota archaeon]